jgi:hypothetical protein
MKGIKVYIEHLQWDKGLGIAKKSKIIKASISFW